MRRRLNRRAQLLSFPIRPHQTQYVIEFALQLRSLQRATWTNSLINGGRRRRAGEVTVTRARITASASDDDDDDDEEENTILTGLDPSGQYEAQRRPEGNLEQIRPRLCPKTTAISRRKHYRRQKGEEDADRRHRRRPRRQRRRQRHKAGDL